MKRQNALAWVGQNTGVVVGGLACAKLRSLRGGCHGRTDYNRDYLRQRGDAHSLTAIRAAVTAASIRSPCCPSVDLVGQIDDCGAVEPHQAYVARPKAD